KHIAKVNTKTLTTFFSTLSTSALRSPGPTGFSSAADYPLLAPEVLFRDGGNHAPPLALQAMIVAGATPGVFSSKTKKWSAPARSGIIALTANAGPKAEGI
ncbi:MAG: hypothetical protein MZU91_11815, partial [Desulfosudis oleivorans]|nr:hypothetical protein [Desulfosudis oleivorans]